MRLDLEDQLERELELLMHNAGLEDFDFDERLTIGERLDICRDLIRLERSSGFNLNHGKL